MRRRFDVQLALGQTPIEKILLPLKSRDELPPILAGLQWIFQTPEINEQIFGLLEQKLLAGKKATGRPGMDLWQILVLGVVRLGLDCDYDRLEDLANHHALLRQILGLAAVRGDQEKPFHYKTLSENVCQVDEELLSQINAIVVQAGRPLFKKNGRAEPIRAKVDSYVLETNVHFPTDVNLLWDAQRKCLDLLGPLARKYELAGWRKTEYWRRQLKSQMIGLGRLLSGGGANKEKRSRVAAWDYVQASYRFEEKVFASWGALPGPQAISEMMRRAQIEYFHDMMIKQLDLVERRLLKGETIPHAEKIFSLFEPHTQWIKKGKLFPPVELGHKVILATDQHELILDFRMMEQLNDAEEVVPMADRLLGRFGSLQSVSFDKGFTREADRQLLELYIPEVIMPKRGKRRAREQEREQARTFRALRRKHNAIESDINCLEHHGLNRCPDKGLAGYQRYLGFGVLAYNLHKLGRQLLQRQAAGRRTRTTRALAA
ncbi:MAG: ISNCY family transposase [Acidobacteriales bacterium]|nr:ISNCY family transposase [Terriglobales bacterium]